MSKARYHSAFGQKQCNQRPRKKIALIPGKLHLGRVRLPLRRSQLTHIVA